jgi:hypothetical protein
MNANSETEPRYRGQRGPDRGPRRLRPKFSANQAIEAAGKAGFDKVRMTIDSDGKITLEMGQAGEPDDKEGQEQWELKRKEWEAKSSGE